MGMRRMTTRMNQPQPDMLMMFHFRLCGDGQHVEREAADRIVGICFQFSKGAELMLERT